MIRIAVIAALLAGIASDQTPATVAPPLREVRGSTIISKDLPAADLTFGKDFRYIGGQRVNLYGVADAEQHLFAKLGMGGVVQRFYWVQFEHFLPTSSNTYNYPAGRSVDLGGFKFTYDTKSWPDYATLQTDDPASDGAALARMLAQQNLAFPKKAVRLRMFYLPSPDHRSELMIIYGEALSADSSIPVRKDGVDLDKDSAPEAAKVLERMKRDLIIQKHD
jgi:hypothetical protein